MNKLFYGILFATALILAACNATKTATAPVQEKAVEPVKEMTTATPGTISFAAANERYSANGTFKKWDFTKVDMNKKDITSLKATINIDLTSIWEKSPKLTDHLKADDYFGVAKYTTATLDIVNVKDKGDGMYTAEMSLSMRGKTQKMKSDFTVTNQNPLTVKGMAKVDRSIFGIGVENTSVPNEIEVTYDTVIPNM